MQVRAPLTRGGYTVIFNNAFGYTNEPSSAFVTVCTHFGFPLEGKVGNTWNTIVTTLADGMHTEIDFYNQLKQKLTAFGINKDEAVLDTPDSTWRLFVRLFNNPIDFTEELTTAQDPTDAT